MMRLQYLHLLGAIGLATAVSGSTLREWTEFRGANGSGFVEEANPPVRWSNEDNVLWRSPVAASGWSSPVVKNDRIFFTGADQETGALIVFCYALDSGRELWAEEVLKMPSNRPKHKKNTDASSTPCLAENRVFAHFGHFGTVCLDFDGNVIWKQTGLQYSPVHGNGSSPVLVDDLLVYHADGNKNPQIVALHQDTGKVVWSVERRTDADKKFSFCTPSLVERDGRKILISPASGAVFAYDPKNGSELWRVEYGQGFSVVPRPVIGLNHAFIASGFMRPNVMAIRLGGEGDVSDSHVTWETSRGGPNTPSMVLSKERLYFVSDGGIVSCVEALTGKRIWQERITGNVSSSPIIAGDRLYLGTEEGVMYVLRAGDTFETIATNDFDERIFATPAVIGDTLVVRTDAALYRIGRP